MKRATLTLLSIIALCFGLAACNSAHAGTNQFSAPLAGYPGVVKDYSVADVRMITASPTGFVMQYTDGNSSDTIPDHGYALLTNILSTAPALSKAIRVMSADGSTPTYINPDRITDAICTTSGTSFTAPTATGNYMRILWKPGYVIVSDPGCATFYALPAIKG